MPCHLCSMKGFPDSVDFCGTVAQRYRQVGNAVPPPLAEALGRALGAALRLLPPLDPAESEEDAW